MQPQFKPHQNKTRLTNTPGQGEKGNGYVWELIYVLDCVFVDLLTHVLASGWHSMDKASYTREQATSFITLFFPSEPSACPCPMRGMASHTYV